MSKDTPEVGDIYGNIGDRRLCRITYISPYGNVHYAYCDEYGNIKEGIDALVMFKGKEFYIYLGKSKTNINDLFKTENEE